jgi:hypothetical protein
MMATPARQRAANHERARLTNRIVTAAKTPKQRTGLREYDQHGSIAARSGRS